MRRALVSLLLASLAASVSLRAKEEQLERVYLPTIARSSCSELCGYCDIPPWLDHVMGCSHETQ